MEAPLITLIYPVFNMADFLRECIDSLLAQNFADWEAVFVDDGSTDATGRILDEYSCRDKRIRVIHQTNRGVSTARNAGLDAAHGEWIWFVDPDDVLLDDALKFVEESVSDGKCDALCFSHCTIFSDELPTSSDDDGHVIVSMEDPNIGKPLLFASPCLTGLPFLRILKRSLFGGVRYPDGVVYLEDSINLMDILSVKARWKYVDKSIYGYRTRSESVSHGYKLGKCAPALQSMKVVLMKARDLLDMNGEEFDRFLTNERGEAQYYMYQAFRRDSHEDLIKMVRAYDSLCTVAGHGFVNGFCEFRCRLVKLGLYKILAQVVWLYEYLYRGISVRTARLCGWKGGE